jgi:hypothetical protein
MSLFWIYFSELILILSIKILLITAKICSKKIVFLIKCKNKIVIYPISVKHMIISRMNIMIMVYFTYDCLDEYYMDDLEMEKKNSNIS